MDPETLANAFEPFFTTKGRDAGTGLGLATVQAIVREGGGAVVAESAPGEGSVFRVWLPVVDGAPEEPEAGGRQAQPAAAAEGVRVIVTEDDEAVRRLVSSVLRHAGYDVLEATDGAEAIAVLDRAAEVHLLVTDLVMPGLDGQELARRARERRPGLPVLFVTGHASPEELSPRVGAAEACLQKPFTPHALLAAVRPLADAFRGAR
jgi:CheY-like chemotaxis protein